MRQNEVREGSVGDTLVECLLLSISRTNGICGTATGCGSTITTNQSNRCKKDPYIEKFKTKGYGRDQERFETSAPGYR